MKSLRKLLNQRIVALVKEYQDSNAFGQAVICQILKELINIQGIINFQVFHNKFLKPFDKSRRKLR